MIQQNVRAERMVMLTVLTLASGAFESFVLTVEQKPDGGERKEEQQTNHTAGIQGERWRSDDVQAL